ncbi:HAD-like domain-containing protein [Gilbertella persicaria]|uniref:Pseudouridine-5'-phosphatase n=1 Tax=Rhizopus stolonifer TaxID=4846 RepID=A0A367KVC1_RHIST|nr:HAD-like domain-containing protein [Gilbertella persicaria]KAI8054951.1 HAD-like domain-containing protein [Gilbertella persicaria]RCI06151.1 Pseudouridine-5'-phosphatase [Rhizopus stolonifer]
MTCITHCIFDMDGLLLDTERVYTEVTQQILDKYADGVKFTWEVKSKLMGRNGDESAAMVVDTYQLPMTTQEYLAMTSIIQEDLFPHVKLLPGVEKLVRHLKAHNIPIAVATSSTRAKFELKTSLNKEIFTLFDVIVCGDDPEIKRGKPSPDLFLAAQKKLGHPASENCLVFEDAVNGVQAALNASMHVVWIPDENIKALTGEHDHGATCVLPSMAYFVPEAFSLPPFRE